jgi:hypothetical protein
VCECAVVVGRAFRARAVENFFKKVLTNGTLRDIIWLQKKGEIKMDFELLFWCVCGIVGLGVLLGVLCTSDDSVSDRTAKRLRGEWYK